MVVDAGPTLICNGINGATGRYSLEDVTPATLARIALGQRLDDRQLAVLQARHDPKAPTCLGTMAGVDPRNLAQAGWAAVFPASSDPGVKKALEPLLALRRAQAQAFYKEFSGDDGVLSGDTGSRFLIRHKVAPGSPANPAKIPYYLLLVGEPSAIPYAFQYELDVTYAVGRIAFATTEEYASYARSVVEAEVGAARRPRSVGIFGTRNDGDRPTALSADHLVTPLADWIETTFPGVPVRRAIGAPATKIRLAELLSAEAPSLMFTASHGMVFDRDDPLHLERQGSLLCQDWPGPESSTDGRVCEDYYLGARDIADTAPSGAVIAFLFACFGAGTPRDDDFLRGTGRPEQIAPESFVGRLPRRLLGHPNGGALAVVGHVERAWGYSFTWPTAGDQLEVFEGTLGALLDGDPIGHALEYFNDKYAALAALVATAQREASFGAVLNPEEVATTWTAMTDARNYVILGDPAVRIL